MANNQEIIQPTLITTGSPTKSAIIPINNPAWAELISMFVVVTVDAVVGQRNFNIDLIDASGNVLSRFTSLVMNPLQIYSISFSQNNVSGSGAFMGQLPEPCFFPPNSSIKLTETNNRASLADSISMNAVISYGH